MEVPPVLSMLEPGLVVIEPPPPPVVLVSAEIAPPELAKLDEVAYVRFASVYRSFKDLGEFMSELKELISERKPPAKK